MSMSKQDFIALADVVRGINPGANCPTWQNLDKHAGLRFQWEWTVKELADFCAAQNPRFNRARWLDYIAGKCGPNGGKL